MNKEQKFEQYKQFITDNMIAIEFQFLSDTKKDSILDLIETRGQNVIEINGEDRNMFEEAYQELMRIKRGVERRNPDCVKKVVEIGRWAIAMN